MQSITTGTAPVYFNEQVYSKIADYLSETKPSSVVIIVDENTYADCLPLLLDQVSFNTDPNILVIPQGEAFKIMETVVSVIDEMSTLLTDRKALVINLGGGVVTDLGGFVASIYMRGVKYINIPTSLLAMVDASVGGKTGVDLGNLKNQIGIINDGVLVGVDTDYLATLAERQMRSGFAEIIKHGLISNSDYWEQIKAFNPATMNQLDHIIYESVKFKSAVVLNDPTEQGQRKILNFGHTLGHAIETYSLETDDVEDLLHGEAIAIGLVLETYLSCQLHKFPKSTLSELVEMVQAYYPKVDFNQEAIAAIKSFMLHDKKNVGGQINFVLLSEIGQAKINQVVDNVLINQAFEFYSKAV